jgi:hypothetical protein
MIGVAGAYVRDRFESTVWVLGETWHNVAVIHPPTIGTDEVHADFSSIE